MAIGKITGSVVADNTLTESNLAFGISGQSAATAWATDTLKVNIIESDDSSGIQLNDSLNISGTLSANTIDVNTLTSGDSSGININDTALYVNGDRVATVTGTETLTNKTIDTANNTITITESDISDLGAYITASSTDTLTNKTFDANGTGNSLSNVEVADFAAAAVVLESEGITSNDNDTTLPTSAAVKDYVDAGTATFTNKTFDANGTGNSISNIEVADFASGEILDEDNMSSDSATKLATQQSIKAYVDSVAGGTLSLGDSASNSGSVDVNSGDNLEFRSGNSITPTVSGNGVTIALNDTIVVNAISSADSTTVRINDSIETENAQINTNLTVDGNAQVKGNLTVQGTTTYIETTNTKISDPLLLLSNGNSGGSDIDAGIMIERGSAGNNAVFYWNEGDDKFKAVTTTSGEDATAITDSATATIVANIEGNVTGTVSDVSNHNTDDIAEGSSNLYYTNTRFDTQLATKDTGDLTEGSNLYYTDVRARASVSVTDAGGDGSLSYNSSSGVITYTGPSAAEVRAHISGGTGVTISSGEIAIGQSVATTADVTFNSVVTNAISSSDSTAVQINDGVNISGTLSVNSIDVNSLTSSDSSGINIDEAKLYVNGASVLTAGSGGDVERTTSTAQITDVLINNSGTVFRIPLANIDISSFNNDAGFASGGVSGFSASTVTSFPVELGDSAARDYGDGEPGGVGTGTAANTDAFGVALGTTFDAMEPNGSVQTTDLGSEEAHVGA